MKKHSKSKKVKEITVYDNTDVTEFIDPSKETSFKSLGFQLPATPPTQVVSIRLPSQLLNELRSISSERDIAYQALVKMMLADAVENIRNRKKKVA